MKERRVKQKCFLLQMGAKISYAISIKRLKDGSDEIEYVKSRRSCDYEDICV